MVDICTPNNTHAEIAIAAAAAGKMILCEKPLSMNLVEGRTMVEAVEKAGVRNTVWYNYRRVRVLRPRSPSSSLTKAGSAGSFIIGPSSCRTGRLTPTCRKAAPRSGAWMPPPPAPA